MKLTKNQRYYLDLLGKSKSPQNWKSGGASVCHALIRMGLAEKRLGYPIGFVITEAGRAALREGEK